MLTARASRPTSRRWPLLRTEIGVSAAAAWSVTRVAFDIACLGRYFAHRPSRRLRMHTSHGQSSNALRSPHRPRVLIALLLVVVALPGVRITPAHASAIGF